MTLSIIIIFFILGLIIGSFLNVVILRHNTERSLGGRSTCMSCARELLWYELIPIFSFCILKGRCKDCKTKIAIQYPIVEFTTGLIFALLFWKFSFIFYADTLIFAFIYSYSAIIFSLLLVISVYDIKHKIIPDTLVFILSAFAFVGMFFFNSSVQEFNFYPHLPSILEFLGTTIVALFFGAIYFISRGTWMGFGDVKLALGLGFFLGMTKMISATMLAFWIGAIVGVILILISKTSFSYFGKINKKSEIPFAPFLALGAFLIFIFNFNFFPFF